MRALLMALLLAQAPRGWADYQRARALTDPAVRVEALEAFLAEYGKGGIANRAREDVVRTLVELDASDEAVAAFVRKAVAAATPGQQSDLRQRLADTLLEMKRGLAVAREISADGGSARLRASHGRILLAVGEREAGRRVLSRVLESNPEFGLVAEALMSVEEDPVRRREYEILARLANPSGLDEAAVDGVYRRWFPLKPIPARRYGPVLVEFFTSASCIPCQGAELAFDALADSGVVAIAHHVNIPGEDPLTHEGADQHRRRRGAMGVPLFFVNGEEVSEGGTRAAGPRILAALEERLPSVDRRAELRVGVSRKGAQLEVEVTQAPQGRLSLALVEREVRHSGPNLVRFHRNVVRAFVAGAARRHVFAAEPGREWQVAAYVESPDARRILAAAIVETPR